MSLTIDYTQATLLSTASYKPTMVDWGFYFLAAKEIDALRLAYLHRNAPFGLVVEKFHDGNYLVTVWGETATKDMGCHKAEKDHIEHVLDRAEE